VRLEEPRSGLTPSGHSSVHSTQHVEDNRDTPMEADCKAASRVKRANCHRQVMPLQHPDCKLSGANGTIEARQDVVITCQDRRCNGRRVDLMSEHINHLKALLIDVAPNRDQSELGRSFPGLNLPTHVRLSDSGSSY
jgi:hypothetical protein